MIRLKPLDKISYQNLRKEYLIRLATSHAVAFDPSDILLEGEQIEATFDRTAKRTTESTRSALDNRPTLAHLKKYLFNEDNTVNKKHLRLLLAGPEPEDMPKSFGGNGRRNTMREVFEEIIGEVGEIRKPHAAKSQEQVGLDEQAKLEGWKICQNIFSYHHLSYTNSSTPEKTAYWLQQQLHVDVCPFCNRIYTSTLFRGSVRASFDHFYPKSVYPYLAISLFNLIPICDVCNKNKSDNAEVLLNALVCNDYDKLEPDEKKTSETISIIYPYDESFDECLETNLPVHVSFRVIPKGIRQWEVLHGKSEQFQIQFQPTDKAGETLEDSCCGMLVPADLNTRFPFKNPKYWVRVKNSVKLLKLEDLYNTHKNEIMRILRNRYQYNRTAIEFILQTLLNKEPLRNSNDTLLLEVRNMLYFANLNPDDWGLIPLNKLKADILKQMDMLEMLSFNQYDLWGED